MLSQKGGYSKDVEHAISMLMSHVQNNKGLLTLWAVRNDSLFEAAVEHNIVSGVSAILSEALPDYQPRWLKGVAGVIVTQVILFLTTRHPITLLEIIQQHVSFQDTLKSFLTPLQKVQLAIYSDIKANPSKSMVLSWLHPSVNVNTQSGGGKSFVPGIGIRAKTTDRWADVSRQELSTEAEKYGVSCVNVAIAFGNGSECSTSDLTKRSPKSEMKKGIKLPKRELNNSLVALIDAVTGNGGNEEDVQDFLNGTLIQDEITGSNSTAQVLSVKLRDSINQLSGSQARETCGRGE
ncbi:unnamed protein product [Porites evermanni]|uniref:Vitellogenin n=1 Tax=Porites evermanni TaxID=104178 RepID=A0ABN8M551_9CNID|nr:unnamed protein product [Porites evermanni]